MKIRLAGALFAWLALLAVPVSARVGTMPAYPGAVHPLPGWENSRLGIATTGDAPKRVVAYYLETLQAQGWRIKRETALEAVADAQADQPAWLTFRRASGGQLDIEITEARSPRTHRPLTFIFCQSKFRL